MPSTGTFVAPELMDLITRALDAACADLRSEHKDDGAVARTLMTVSLMTAVGAGERDPYRLKLAALQAIDR